MTSLPRAEDIPPPKNIKEKLRELIRREIEKKNPFCELGGIIIDQEMFPEFMHLHGFYKLVDSIILFENILLEMVAELFDLGYRIIEVSKHYEHISQDPNGLHHYCLGFGWGSECRKEYGNENICTKIRTELCNCKR